MPIEGLFKRSDMSGSTINRNMHGPGGIRVIGRRWSQQGHVDGPRESRFDA